MFEQILQAFFGPLLRQLELQQAEIRALRQLVAKWLLPVPGELRVTLTLDEDGTMKAFITLPPLPSPAPAGLKSIDKQNVWVTDSAGVELFRAQYPVDGSVLVADPVPVDLGAEYDAFANYQDAATPPNVSTSVTQHFKATDDVPPDAPGAFGAITFTDN